MQFKMPVELEEEQKERTKALEKNVRLYGFLGWSVSLLNGNKIVSTSEIDSVFNFANDLTCEDDPSCQQPDDPASYPELRADAIAAFAAATVIKNWDWIQSSDKCLWFKKQLLIAATRPMPLSKVNDAISIFPIGYRRSAARAICALQQKINDETIRQNIFALSVDVSNEVRLFLFNGLKDLWVSDPKLVWQCIDANIKKANIFNESNRAIRNYLPTEVDTDILLPVLYCIPTDEINQLPQMNKIVDLLEEMLLFTITSYSFYEEKESHYNPWDHNNWNQMMFRTASNVGLLLPESTAKEKFFNHILESWTNSPSMMATFLRSLLSVGSTPELENKLAKLWPRIGENVILAGNSCNTEDFSEIVGLLIFADPKGIITWKVNEWRPLITLIPFIEKWCQEVGWYADNFTSLVRFLKSVGFELFVDYGINWLFECLSRIDNEETALQRVSVSLSELLSNSWVKYGEAIKRDCEKMRCFASMVDKLANYGDPTAIRLQSKLLEQ